MSITRREPIPPPRRVLGIDPSLTGTGIATFINGQYRESKVFGTTPETAMPHRLLEQRRRLLLEIGRLDPTLVAMEAEIWTSNPAQSSQASAVQAIYQTAIYSLDPAPRFLSVNVSHVKKWLGAQKKQEVLLAVYKRYQIEFKNDNAADAYVIGRIGDALLLYEAAGERADAWTKPQIEVLVKLKQTGLVWETPPVPRTRRKKRV